ncbi:hypothetical protein DS745_20110 [Anaerobacillus alkaliphilus]|uniref:Uncharacterized protein n=1 Tax=Anaerobacillus alkaliphilus TaxID=1548597 RepID=A0A4Q0VQ44_9BACI|nr:hypothetical protein [Anaerobacillus alkaliphilus]RXI98622.1 hypothetical protein DS745_20110 [Anaerobacillus alkaliphilus]
MIFSNIIIDGIYADTKSLLPNVLMKKEELLEEIKMFEYTMAQVKKHPWQDITIKEVRRDQSSPLYQKIQSSYVGSDPEEDYKEVIVWEIAEMLYITAAVDHDPTIALKWDVVVFN